MRTVAIIPAYNEERRIEEVIKGARKHVDKVVVVDDGSSDGTARLAEKLCMVIQHPRNKGKGVAIRTGISYACRKFDAIILIDADGEHDPSDIPALLRALSNHDLVVGRRGQYRSPARALLNRFGDLWFGILLPKHIDVHSGFRAMRSGLARTMHLSSRGFEVEVDMLLEARYHDARMASVPISTKRANKSGVKFKDYVKINNFFDRWILQKGKSLNINPAKKTMLIIGAGLGLFFGSILERV